MVLVEPGSVMLNGNLNCYIVFYLQNRLLYLASCCLVYRLAIELWSKLIVSQLHIEVISGINYRYDCPNLATSQWTMHLVLNDRPDWFKLTPWFCFMSHWRCQFHRIIYWFIGLDAFTSLFMCRILMRRVLTNKSSRSKKCNSNI